MLCAGTEFSLDNRFAAGDWGLRCCQGCGLVETFPFPTKERQVAENEDKYGRPFLEMQQAHRSHNRRVHNLVLADIEKASRLSGRKLLDVGCGAGQFLRAAIDAGWDAEGVELNRENACAVAEFGIRVFWGTLEDAAFSDATFDVVSLWDVLEHIPCPVHFLLETLRILKPGGLVFLQSPNIDSDVASIWGIRWPWLCLPDHLYHFSPRTIDILLQKAGFLVHRVSTWEDFVTRLKSIANATENASKIQKGLRVAIGAGPAALSRLSGVNLWRMGLVRAIAYKAGS
jgi:2-polyprenyl-3-methyl-5-hydroxy-6-metoxy-1,4-benzoquinol methylase